MTKLTEILSHWAQANNRRGIRWMHATCILCGFIALNAGLNWIECRAGNLSIGLNWVAVIALSLRYLYLHPRIGSLTSVILLGLTAIISHWATPTPSLLRFGIVLALGLIAAGMSLWAEYLTPITVGHRWQRLCHAPMAWLSWWLSRSQHYPELKRLFAYYH